MIDFTHSLHATLESLNRETYEGFENYARIVSPEKNT